MASCTSESPPEAVNRVRAGSESEISPPPTPSGLAGGRLGVLTYPNSAGWGRVLGSPGTSGALVVAVLPSSAASRAGLRRGDVVTEVDAEAVANDERFVTLVRGPVARRVRLRIERGEGAVTLTVALAAPSTVSPIAHYDALVGRDPRDAVAFLLRAQARIEDRDGLLDVNRALAISPDFPEAIACRARLLWRRSLASSGASAQTDQQRGVEDFAKALALDPRAIKILVSRGQSLLEAGLNDSAERDAVTAVGIDPTYAAAHDLLARTRSLKGDVAGALRSAREAVDLAPFDPGYYRTLALAFLDAGRRADAEATVSAGRAVAQSAEQRAFLEDVLRSPSPSPSPG